MAEARGKKDAFKTQFNTELYCYDGALLLKT